jgi:multimeric flavodoxin WrbA
MNKAITNVLILDGSREDDMEARIARDSVLNELEKVGIKSSCYVLRDQEIASCTGCFKCWTKTPGVCAINDAQRRIDTDMVKSDMLVLITPVTFGGYSSTLKKGMDRLIPILLPYFEKIDGETHHPIRRGKGWDVFGVGTIPKRDGGKERLFQELMERNSINMQSKRKASCIVLKGSSEDDVQDAVVGELRKVIA